MALHAAGVAALQAIDARDADRLFDVGERIELACESCHSQYWYPNQVLPYDYYPEDATESAGSPDAATP